MPANLSNLNSSRRQLLLNAGFGFGWLATSSLANAQPHFAPKAKRILQLFTLGGMSHMDTFDYKPELEALQMCYNAIQQGANGVDMGRNIFQSDAPISMMQAVRGVVHEGLTPEQGFQMYNDLKAKGTK